MVVLFKLAETEFPGRIFLVHGEVCSLYVCVRLLVYMRRTCTGMVRFEISYGIHQHVKVFYPNGAASVHKRGDVRPDRR